MKKGILSLILITCAVFCVFGQNSGPIDLVLLLDTSTSMGSSYDKVNDYITGSFLSEFLRTGDTFHLITFSANPRLDIARRISARGDIETIIGRMLIQYPVETGNDISAAVNYADSYIATLPPRPKKIVMVSAAGPETSNLINSAKQRFSSKNTTFDFVSVTGAVPGTQNLSNPPGSGRTAGPRQSSSQGSSTQGAQSGTASGTTNQGGASGAQKTTQGTTQGSSQQGAGTQSSSQGGVSGAQSTTQGTTDQGTTTQGAQGTSQTGAQSTTQPSSQDSSAGASAQGTSSQDNTKASDQNQDSQRQQDTSKSFNKEKKQKESRGFYPSLPMIIGIIAAILLLVLLIIFASRRLGSSPNRVMASVSAAPLGQEKEDRFSDHSRDLASYAARQNKQRETPYNNRPIRQNFSTIPVVINPSGPLLLNLFVEDQNTSIGKRNIHSLKSGYSLTVGGGKSDDFMIFLVPLPSHLGDIRRNGSQLTFIPRKPMYFPDIGTNEVRDCINKRIRVVSDKKYEMWFSFVMYEDPLIALNRVLHSIKVPG